MHIFGWSKRGAIMWGLFLILVGACILLSNYGLFSFPFKLARDWPMILIGWGILKIIDAFALSRGVRRQKKTSRPYQEIVCDLEAGKISAQEAIREMEE